MFYRRRIELGTVFDLFFLYAATYYITYYTVYTLKY